MRPVDVRDHRARWFGQQDRIRAISHALTNGEDWTQHLLVSPSLPTPLPNLESCRRDVLPGEAARRDLRGILLQDLDLTGSTGLADCDLDSATLDNVQLYDASLT